MKARKWARNGQKMVTSGRQRANVGLLFCQDIIDKYLKNIYSIDTEYLLNI